MPDIFDTIEAEKPKDIFDEIDVPAKPSKRAIIPMPSPLAAIPFPSMETAPTIPADVTESFLPFERAQATVSPTETLPMAAAKSLYNVALGLPAFATSTAGMGSMVAGPVAPRVVTGAFLGDMLNNLRKSVPEVAKEWDSMTPAKKVEAGINLGATALMALGFGSKTIKGFQRNPAGLSNETQRKMVQFTQELAEKDPEKFGQMAKDAATKKVDIEQRTPEATAPLPSDVQPLKKEEPISPAATEALPKQPAEAEPASKPVAQPGETIQPAAVEAAKPEKVIAAAVKIGGETVTGVDHASAIEKYAKEHGFDFDETFMEKHGQIDSGFVTSTGRFVELDEAAKISGKPLAGHAAEIITETKKPTEVQNAPETRTVEEGFQPEREGVAPLGVPDETGTRNRIQPEEKADVQAKEQVAETAAEPPAPKPKEALPAQPATPKEGVGKGVLDKIDEELQGKWITPAIKGQLTRKRAAIVEGQSKGQQYVSYRHSEIGSNRWGVVDTATGNRVEFPVTIDHPERGKIQTTRINFQTKKEALDAIKSKPPTAATEGVEKPRLQVLTERIEAGEKLNKKEREEYRKLKGQQEQEEPEVKAEQPPGMGELGAAAKGAPAAGGKAQIEQLADAFRNKAPLKDRVFQLMRESFDYGVRSAQAKDALSKALNGLKTSGESIWTALTKFEKPDDLLKAKGELSAALESRGWRVREFAKAVKSDIPDVRRRNAIAKWIDAGGDDARLALGEAATKPEFRKAYRDARNLTPDEKVKAQNIQNFFDARLQEAIDAGVLETGLEDYIHRIYPKDTPARRKALAYVQSGILSKNPGLARQRFYEFDYEAEAAGLKPVQDFLPRITDYETSLSRAIAAREFVKKMTTMTAPDGRPVIGIKGVGVPIEDAAGVRTGTVIKPLGDFRKANDPSDPLNYRGDYVNKEYGSLSRWKWVGTDTDGKPIFLQGDVAVHPDFVGRVQALLEPSHVRFGRYPRLGGGLLTASSTVKQTMLDFSGFHQVQIALHGLEHRVNPFHLVQEVDFTDPKVDGLLKGGLTLGGEYHASNMGEGLVGRSLSQHIPGLGPVLEAYHSWLFQSFIPRMKLTMGLHALERNRSRYAKELASGKMTEDDLNYMTAKQANAAFGELNYVMLERSKTTQDLARLILLAPDFLEARGRFVGQALNWKYGKEQRVALLLGALTMYFAARVANKIVDDQYHLEPENAFSLVKGNTSWNLRTVQGDVLHMLTKPLSFFMNRLNPVYTRTLLEAITQRDQFGRKRNLWQVLGDTVSTAVPISMRSNRERNLFQSFLTAMGITAKRYNDVTDVRKLADAWKKKNNIREAPGEFIYDADKDPLRPLKLALSDGDDAGAVKEIKRIFDNKLMDRDRLFKYFENYSRRPFTGSAANERRFKASLSGDDLKTYQAAEQHRNRMGLLFKQALAKYYQTAKMPNPSSLP